jgi:hypothetical protein
MRGRQSEHPRHVLRRRFPSSIRSDTTATLQLPQMIEAPDHEREVLRLSDQLVDRQRVRGEQPRGSRRANRGDGRSRAGGADSRA